MLFALTCILPIADIKALDGYANFGVITIPKNKNDWYYSGLNYKKLTNSYQWYKNFGAIAALGNNEPIRVRTWNGNVNSAWLTLDDDQLDTWGEGTSSSANGFPGTYGVDISRVSSGLSDLSHSGIWYLDDKWL